MARRKTYTRMEKSITSELLTAAQAVNPDISLPVLFQLEGGDEECQIKRIVLSASLSDDSDDDYVSVRLALFQETPDITDLDLEEAIIYSMAVTNNSVTLINETTTVRVPRGWHLALYFVNPNSLGVGQSNSAFVNCQLNYKVLS